MKISKSSLRVIIGIVCVVAAVIISFTYYLVYERGNKDNTTTFDYVNGSYVEFIDVGQADCTLIASKGKYCLIDTGNADDYNTIRGELRDKGIKTLDLIIISHYHSDHTGSLQSIVNNFDVLNLIYPPEFPDTKVSNDVLYAKKECIASDGEFYFAKPGMNIKLGDFTLTVLFGTDDLSEENNRSIYIMAKIEDKKFLFTGDGELAAESELLKQNLNIDCDVLKVPHHGARTSSSESFLDECKPEYAVISCGKNNTYGHPHKDTIKRYEKIKAQTYITRDKGNITFVYLGGELSVITEKG